MEAREEEYNHSMTPLGEHPSRRPETSGDTGEYVALFNEVVIARDPDFGKFLQEVEKLRKANPELRTMPVRVEHTKAVLEIGGAKLD